jgi:hypothetical protein
MSPTSRAGNPQVPGLESVFGTTSGKGATERRVSVSWSGGKDTDWPLSVTPRQTECGMFTEPADEGKFCRRQGDSTG